MSLATISQKSQTAESKSAPELLEHAQVFLNYARRYCDINSLADLSMSDVANLERNLFLVSEYLDALKAEVSGNGKI